MSSERWTIDSIAHALPHPVTRQKFLAEVNLAPVAELPSVLQRWVRVAEEWTAAGPRLETVRAHFKATGVVPRESSAVDATDEVVQLADEGRSRDVA